MRPVRLTLQAFGPYPGRVVIDFRDAVEAGLFGIYGQTGSGKSTIFSAMTFALFGEAAKAEQDAPSLRSDHADPDVMTEAEFVFDIGERRYVVLRRPDQMRPKARGEGETRSAHEAYLFDATGMSLDEITDAARGKIVAEKKVRDVDAAVVEMLGYGSEQFRQIVLLPQGRFEKFLSAKTKERLKILRELFDVSLYEKLMADLKSAADEAERQVRQERELCARQLAAEGFESTDALIAGIETATAKCAEFRANEETKKATAEAAEKALRQAEAIEEKFAAAEKMRQRLRAIEARKGDVEALSEQAQQAERARGLIDVEERVRDAEREVGEAESAREKANETAEGAKEQAEKAAEALRSEEERAEEVENLRKRSAELERYGRILEAAADSNQTVEIALKEQRDADNAFKAAKAQLSEMQEKRTSKSAALKVARETETKRTEIAGRRTELDKRHLAAQTYEGALQDVATAKGAVEEQLRMSEAASGRAKYAQENHETAEKNLAAAQAVHLATRLEAGSPCPVCGATEHPLLATGAISSAGLDKAFRESREAWLAADREARQAGEALVGVQATLEERRKRLSALEPPEERADVIAAQIGREDAALAALGPRVNIVVAEAGIEDLGRQIGELERKCDELRDCFDERRNKATEAKAARDGRLAEVPENLRDAPALAATLQKVAGSLESLQAARIAAEKALSTAREKALGAVKDLESADKTLSDSKARHQKAVEVFRTRLAGAGLTSEAFQSLKPAIETLNEDRETVETYRREHKSASDAVTDAASAIEGMSRPDIGALRETHQTHAEALGRATEERVAAQTRVDHLDRLRKGMEETLRKLDEAEAASGPLRGLAALVNGQNSQRLTLETFAIGAMFDQILEAANLRFGPMTNYQYSLEREMENGGRGKRGLGTQVFDAHTGKSRATSTLSGGETFIAALALALGLADVVEAASGKVRLDTIFIDEGFGSLDTENGSGTLEQVLQVLNSIVRQNRAVGLISHVPLVQEAIPNGFYVRKGMSGSSVEERGLV
ncbi:SMC family ATPase [Marinovum sp. SP66]|uniref:AAA family ATPase n=1 Tax=Marinovum TaxID=367771 RepID=UPI00237ABA3D|nr:SMC family ATPase [Marinovum sp. SP66]MDD9739304.1 SMC family ATPase [Marinovum sp. SP66]